MSENIVPIGDWGKHLLEELLFRAAERVGADTSGADSVEVTLTFRLRPDLVADCLEISVPGVVESALITRLPRPF
jgi:2-keto-4-pentenoate hydratase